jgi:hypothetical protein
MLDADENITDAPVKRFIEASNQEDLWWALHRILSALAAARAEDPACKGQPDNRGGLYKVVHYTADHWTKQIPGNARSQGDSQGDRN